MLKRERQRRFVLLALVLFVSVDASAQLLNSERIEQTFGSYGIDVLFSDDALRLSGLYSTDDGEKIVRTFAIVGYPSFVDDEIAGPHRQILSGGSIGAVFRAAGWTVLKTRHVFFRTSMPEVARLMRLPDNSALAAHAYRLSVSNAGKRLEYAWIIEIHHPDYLSGEDLVAIYGPAASSELPDTAQALLALGQRRIPQIVGSAFGEQGPQIDDGRVRPGQIRGQNE